MGEYIDPEDVDVALVDWKATAENLTRGMPGPAALAEASESLLAAAECCTLATEAADLRATAEWLHKLAEAE